MEQKGEELVYVERGKVHTLVPRSAPMDVARPSKQVKTEKQNEPQVDETRRMLIKGLLGALALGGLYLAQKRAFGISGESGKLKPEDIQDEVRRLNSYAESSTTEKSPFDLIVHDTGQTEKGVARSIVDEMKHEVLEKHSSFEGMMEVTKKFEQQIRQAARENNFPQDLALGIVFIENGGAEDLTSAAGARGPAQLMPETARRFGLQVDEEVDERTDPEKCFKAMCRYLAEMREMFGGDAGIATWGYHAGEGNVYDALWIYFQDTKGVDLGNYLTATSSEVAQMIVQRYKEQIYQDKVSVHQVLSNDAVKSRVLNFLGDETELYPYKAVAAAEIFEKA